MCVRVCKGVRVCVSIPPSEALESIAVVPPRGICLPRVFPGTSRSGASAPRRSASRRGCRVRVRSWARESRLSRVSLHKVGERCGERWGRPGAVAVKGCALASSAGRGDPSPSTGDLGRGKGRAACARLALLCPLLLSSRLFLRRNRRREENRRSCSVRDVAVRGKTRDDLAIRVSGGLA